MLLCHFPFKKKDFVTQGNFLSCCSSEGPGISLSLCAEQSSSLAKSTCARIRGLPWKQNSVDAVHLGCGLIGLEKAESSDQHLCENRAQKEDSCKDRAWRGASLSQVGASIGQGGWLPITSNRDRSQGGGSLRTAE